MAKQTDLPKTGSVLPLVKPAPVGPGTPGTATSTGNPDNRLNR
ncbi:hypothetical protein [Sphingomonas chungangi]|nr:hypothetical protein [Sphingomonas chungangi]